MPAIDQIDDIEFDLCWARGDDDPRGFTVKLLGVPVDISTWTMGMAINTVQNPKANNFDQTEVFTVTGTFLTDGTDGKIVFTPPPTSLDDVAAPSVAYYDVNRLTPSKKTILKGRVLFVMDIDKA